MPDEFQRTLKNKITKTGKFGKVMDGLPLKMLARLYVAHEAHDTQFTPRAMNGQGDARPDPISASLFIHFFRLLGCEYLRRPDLRDRFAYAMRESRIDVMHLLCGVLVEPVR